MRRAVVGLLLAGTLLTWTAMAAAQSKVSAGDNWQTDLSSWRAQHAKDLQAPQGWLALIGLDWLKAGDNSFGAGADNAIPLPAKTAAHLGVLHLEGNTVELLPPGGESGFPKGMLVDGRTPSTGQKLALDVPGPPSKITIGTLAMVVVRRGDRIGLRTRDSQAPSLTGFHGLRWYPPAAQFRIQARWIPYTPPKQIAVPTVIGTEEKYDVPGVAEFTMEGKTFRLEPVLEGPEEKDLFFILRDATSKTETYQASRFLYTEFPDHGLTQPGMLLLDFNRAENPPCAYSHFTTCPLPPKGNVLPVAITAGEKRYHE
jgi:uncharacterized protein (DUF1684 family)